MEKLILEILTSLTVSGSLTCVLVWLSKNVISERLKNAIKTEYDQKLETHKAQLKSASDMEVERLKAQLQYTSEIEVEQLKSNLSITANKHNILFTQLQEKRATVIADIYSDLRNLIDVINNFIKNELDISIQEKTEEKKQEEIIKLEEMRKLILEFHSYKSKKQIFIPKVTAEKLAEFDRLLARLVEPFLKNKINPVTKSKDEWRNIYSSINKPVQAALNDLENEFRKLLGEE